LSKQKQEYNITVKPLFSRIRKTLANILKERNKMRRKNV